MFLSPPGGGGLLKYFPQQELPEKVAVQMNDTHPTIAVVGETLKGTVAGGRSLFP